MYAKKLVGLSAIAMLIFSTGTTRAQTYNWVGGTGTQLWQLDANWDNVGYPDGVGHRALLGAPGAQTHREISSASITLGELLFGTSANNREIRGIGNTTAGTLIFDNGVSNALLSRGNVGTTNGTEMKFTTVQLNSNLTVDYTGTHVTSMLRVRGNFTGAGGLNLVNISGDATWAGFQLDGGTHTYAGGTTLSNATLTLNGSTIQGGIAMSGSSNLRLNGYAAGSLQSNHFGTITGTGTVMTAGNGTSFTFNNDNNAWEGQFRIGGDFPGAVRFTSIGNVGSGPSALGNPQNASQGVIFMRGGGSSLEYIGSGDTTDRVFEISAFTGNWNTTISASGSTTVNSPFEITSNLTGTGAGWLRFGGTGAGHLQGNIGINITEGLRKIDAGTWTLSGNNTYTKPTFIDAGTLQIGAGGTNGTLGSGNVTNNAALVFNRSNDYTVSNLISGSGTLTQAGGGRTILTNSNTYSGQTHVNDGTLLVNGSLSSGGGNVNVNANGTLGGTGIINRAVVLNGGVLSPGASAGTITIGGNLSGTGTYFWELGALEDDNSGTAGVDWDLVAMTIGNANASGLNLELDFGLLGLGLDPDGGDPFWETDHTWLVLELAGEFATNNGATNFLGIANGNFGAGTFTTFVDEGDQIYLAFTAADVAVVPEPQTAMLLVCALLGLAVYGWRKRK